MSRARTHRIVAIVTASALAIAACALFVGFPDARMPRESGVSAAPRAPIQLPSATALTVTTPHTPTKSTVVLPESPEVRGESARSLSPVLPARAPNEARGREGAHVDGASGKDVLDRREVERPRASSSSSADGLMRLRCASGGAGPAPEDADAGPANEESPRLLSDKEALPAEEP